MNNITFPDGTVIQKPYKMNPWRGKHWYHFGDSTSCYANKNFPDYIAERTGVITHNLARAGARIRNDGTNSIAVVEMATSKTWIPTTATVDILTMVAGYNERTTFVDDGDNTSWTGEMFVDGSLNYDKATVYGALDIIAKQWYTYWPEATKAWFTIFPCHNDPNGKFELFINDIIKEVGKYWNIPVFDAYNEVGLPVWMDEINEKYYMKDRIHLNDLGNYIASKYVQAKVETLMVK